MNRHHRYERGNQTSHLPGGGNRADAVSWVFKVLSYSVMSAVASCATQSRVIADVGHYENTRNSASFDYKESIDGHYRECSRVGASLPANAALSELILVNNQTLITHVEKVRVVWRFNYSRQELFRNAVRDQVDILAIDYRTEYGEATLFLDDAVATFCLSRKGEKVSVELVLLSFRSKLKLRD